MALQQKAARLCGGAALGACRAALRPIGSLCERRPGIDAAAEEGIKIARAEHLKAHHDGALCPAPA